MAAAELMRFGLVTVLICALRHSEAHAIWVHAELGSQGWVELLPSVEADARRWAPFVFPLVRQSVNQLTGRVTRASRKHHAVVVRTARARAETMTRSLRGPRVELPDSSPATEISVLGRRSRHILARMAETAPSGAPDARQAQIVGAPSVRGKRSAP